MILTLPGALLAPSLLAGGAPASRAPALRPPPPGTLGRAPSCPPRCVCGEAAERDAAGVGARRWRDGAAATREGGGTALAQLVEAAAACCDPTQEGRGRRCAKGSRVKNQQGAVEGSRG